MSVTNYKHSMAAHCESGTIAGLLRHNGLVISEPMVLGVCGGIFFAYLDMPSLAFPTFVVRTKPGDLRRRIEKRLGVRLDSRTFRNPADALHDLRQLIDKGIPTAIALDMFYMEYIPSYMRAHFNGHFVTVTGYEDKTFSVSDCYYPQIAQVSEESMMKARFALGDLAPKGFRFYPQKVTQNPDLKRAIIAGIKQAVFYMVATPVPFIGVKGIRLFANKVTRWPTLARDIEHLSHETMMINLILEERGTGGAGFRFMYATFLREAAVALGRTDLADMGKQMMQIGDQWREISLFVARIGKQRDLGPNRFSELRVMILKMADEEERFFKQLGKMIK